MAGAGIYAVGAAHLHNSLGGVADGTSGVDHIVEEDAVLALHVADDVHDLALVGLLAALVHDGQAHVQLLGEGAGAGHRAHIGRDDHHVLALFAELLGVIVHEHGVAQQVIHGDIEETLDLAGVQVHGQHAVGAGGGEHIGHQLGGDGIAGLGLAVLAGIAEIGDHGGDTAGAGTLAGVDHDEQLHQAVVDGFAGGVDEEHIAAADGLVQGDGRLAVGEAFDLCLAQLDADELADLLCQRGIGVACKDLHILAVRNHGAYSRFLSEFL